jgi:hypothetical protein
LMSAAAGNGDTEGAEGVLVRCLAGYAGSCWGLLARSLGRKQNHSFPS